MSEMQQGEEYIEEDLDEFDDEEGFVEDDEDYGEIDMILGFPKKYVYVAAVAIGLLLLLFVIVFTRKKKDNEIVPPDINIEYSQVDDVQFYDDGFDDFEEEEVEYEPEYEVGEMLNGYMWDGEKWVEPTPEIDFETNKRLRAAGYTGDEIEYALRNGFDTEALIQASNELYDEEAKKALERMSDSASEEFKFLLDRTYFGEVGYEFVPQSNLPAQEQTIVSNSFVVNADYIKCPTYGSQLYLKCKVASDLNVFMIMTPQRWETLPASGNIVLRVYYTQYGPNRYVTEVKEVDSTLETIDTAAENTDSLEEIIDE